MADAHGRGGRMGRLLAGFAIAFALPTAARVDAQIRPGGGQPRDTSRLRPELRIDHLAATAQALHAGVGVSVPAGTYARFGVVAGAGPGWEGSRTFASARIDLTGRFMIDPFRRSRWGASIGGGIGVRHDDGESRAVAILLADVEGPGRAGWIPFASAGIGGGLRVGAGVRRAATVGR